MEEILKTDTKTVIIENKTIVPWKVYKGTEQVSSGPMDFQTEKTTVWSFPSRGNWASHTPQYRGNWPPEVVRNIITLYSKPGDTVLDPMVGGGTTPVECKLLNRNSISVDINPDAIAITRDRLDLPKELTINLNPTKHRTYVGDTRNLDLINNNSVDLITAHPPYVNIIKYTNKREGDLSQLDDYLQFYREFCKAIQEYYRVLKPGGYCAVLIGDTHNKGHCVPVSFRLMLDFLREGFLIKESIIKKEWNCESEKYADRYKNCNFMLTMHEHLFIFKKPRGEEYYRNSSIDFFFN